MVDQITLTIDGREVKTRPGNNVLQAAMDAGLYIPYLCYYPGTKAFGACRMCLVQVEGGRGSPASCTTPVANGMVVRSDTAELVALRRGIMDMLISEHPHGCLTCHRIDLCGPADICLRHVSVNDRCVTCPKNERCELKDTVRHLEMDLDTPLTYNNRHLPLKTKDPFWEMDMNLCIVCGRCVRVCDEIRGDYALTFTDRSGRSLIGTSHGTSLLESGCEFCGACIDACPTGALVERDHKWEKAARTVTTVCTHCPVGCEVKLEVSRRNRVIRSIGNLHGAANRGQVCFKGKFGMEFVNNRTRFQKPLVRRDGVLEEASWDEALGFVAEALSRYKGDQYALIASPRGTNEDNYVAQKFARVVMGTNNVDVSSNLRPELVRPLGDMLGYQAGTNPIWELDGAKCILVVSSNITEEHNVAAVPIKRAAKRGAKLIVIDPRETELTRYATTWLRPRPGSEGSLVAGMIRAIVDLSLDDQPFVADRCENLHELRNSLWAIDLLKVEALTALPQGEIRDAARVFATTKPAAILYALDTVLPDLREPCVRALVNLALATGNVGIHSGGLYPLYPGTNEQGSKDVGCSPIHLPGYGEVDDDRARRRFDRAWDVSIPANRGLGMREIVAAIEEGRLKALHVIGDSPNFSNGEMKGFLDALGKLELLVVQDSAPSELTEMAHAVLPSATFAEKSGTYTNMERRVQLLRPAVSARGEEEPDWRTIARLASRMGAYGFEYENVEGILEEISSLVELYGGISHQRLASGSLQWPCPAADMVDTPVLYSVAPHTIKHRLAAMKLVAPSRHRDPEYPLLLARGRLLHDGDRDMEIGIEDGRNIIRRDQTVELHPDDARALDVSEGDWVEVVSSGERMRGIARLSSPHAGLVCVTSLFGELAHSLDASTESDPMLKAPGLPLVPVRIEKAVPVGVG